MKKINTVLFGLGTVNLGFLKLLISKRNELRHKYNMEFVVVAVADSSGVAVHPQGFDYEFLLQFKGGKHKVSALPEFQPQITFEKIPDFIQADLLIESSPGNIHDGQPGLAVARQALTKGWAVVFANKAPLVFAFDELHHLAKKHSCRIAFSSTVCGGLPVINVLQRDLKLSTLIRLRGIFNATSNYILQELEKGESMSEAIKEAQRIGAAEADPTHDTHGHDTANKLFIIMKSFARFDGAINEIEVEGIQQVTPLQIAEAKASGKKIKLIATAEQYGSTWKLSVRPTEMDADSFLGSCDGWEMGIEIHTDWYESIYLKNYEADPVGTSAAVLRDAIDLFSEK